MRFYGYPKCDTCRKARKWLDERGIDYEFIDVTQNPPPREDLERILGSGEYQIKDLFNTSGGEYRRLNLRDRLPGLSRSQAMDLLTSNGRLLRRPVVMRRDRATVGFREAAFASVWG